MHVRLGKHTITSLMILIFMVVVSVTCEENKKKIIALVPGRNEARFMPNCFRNLSAIVDGIVYLDDASTDDSVMVAKSLQQECRIESIIEKKEWYRDEPGDRNKLLAEGRRLGGTHFVVLDLDELFTAPCIVNNYLREKILCLRPGERLRLLWTQLWKGLSTYLHKPEDLSIDKDFIFCDNKKAKYQSNFIHTPRTPHSLRGTVHKIESYDYSVLHFAFVNWRNLLVKHNWYRCLERIRSPNTSIEKINKKYKPGYLDEKKFNIYEVNKEWLAFSFFDSTVYYAPEIWREKQVLEWLDLYGKDYFAALNIWDVDWNETLSS